MVKENNSKGMRKKAVKRLRNEEKGNKDACEWGRGREKKKSGKMPENGREVKS